MTLKQQLTKVIQLIQSDKEVEDVLFLLSELYLYELLDGSTLIKREEMN